MYRIFSHQNDTKIINFDEGVLILWPFFWGNVIFKICHFCLKSHHWRTANFNCLAPAGKVSALALKNVDNMNKENHSLRNFAALQNVGIFTFLNCYFFQLYLSVHQMLCRYKWHACRLKCTDKFPNGTDKSPKRHKVGGNWKFVGIFKPTSMSFVPTKYLMYRQI